MPNNIFYERIRNTGEQQGYSVKQIAEGIGVSISSFNDWKKSGISSSSLIAASKFLHTSIDYLLGLSDDPYVREDYSPQETELIRCLKGYDLSGEQINMLKSAISGILKFDEVEN